MSLSKAELSKAELLLRSFFNFLDSKEEVYLTNICDNLKHRNKKTNIKKIIKIIALKILKRGKYTC